MIRPRYILDGLNRATNLEEVPFPEPIPLLLSLRKAIIISFQTESASQTLTQAPFLQVSLGRKLRRFF
jgi:hypothetical protein